uniref:Exosome complex component MTR3 n=1 Tax=Lygus hesperus TaxID=30085 RepID=A0A146M602_LYGHE
MIDNEEIEEMLKEIKKNEKGGAARVSLVDLLPPERKPESVLVQRRRDLLDGRRFDRRELTDHRPLFIQLGTVSDARGSCYIEVGDTKVVVSVRGPKEIPNIKEYTEMCEIECLVEYAPFSNSTGVDEGYLCQALKKSLEPVLCRHEFPNLQITISAFILEDGGSVLSAAINGASLALTHARLPCFGIATSVTAAVFKERIVVDPDFHEETLCLKAVSDDSQLYGLATLAYMPDLEQITFYEQNGCSDRHTSLFDSLTSKCQEVHKICSQHALKEAKNSVKSLVAAQDATKAMRSLKVL